MSVKSIFDFKFPAEVADEGLTTCKAIGHDMIPLEIDLLVKAKDDAL